MPKSYKFCEKNVFCLINYKKQTILILFLKSKGKELFLINTINYFFIFKIYFN